MVSLAVGALRVWGGGGTKLPNRGSHGEIWNGKMFEPEYYFYGTEGLPSADRDPEKMSFGVRLLVFKKSETRAVH